MPKTTNETRKKKQLEEKEIKVKKTTKRKTTTSKKGGSKVTTPKTKSTKSGTKAANSRVTSSKKKTRTSSEKKQDSTKKTTVAKKKPATTRKRTSKKETPVSVLEYYDLPYRYNQTVVKVLAQTPTTLFVYWDISDDDRSQYQLQYGDHFFETTKPVLLIHNETMNYTYELEINDFANSWYLRINDPDCKYFIELGRRPKVDNLPTYIPITTSNKIDAPNNHVLFNSINSEGKVSYRNIKTKSVFEKKVAAFFPNMITIYPLSDLYQKLYPNEWQEIKKANINNPSSGGISSFK